MLFSVIMLMRMQSGYANTNPYEFYGISICRDLMCGNIQLMKQREVLTLRNNLTSPVDIKGVFFANGTMVDERAGLVIESSEFVSLYTLPGNSSYQFIINAISDNIYPTEVRVVYNDTYGFDKDKVAVAKVYPAYTQNIYSNVASESGEQIINLEPLKLDVHFYPSNTYKGGTMSAVPLPVLDRVYSENETIPIGENGYTAKYIRPHVEVLEFKKPGIKTLKIMNKWDNDVTIEGVLFDINKFSMVQVSRGATVQNFRPGYVILPGKSYKLQIQTKENASASVYPDGTRFVVAYKVKVRETEETRYAEFRVKVNYNEDISFYERNLLFTKYHDYDVYEKCLSECGGAVSVPQCKRVGMFSYDCRNACTEDCSHKPQTRELILKNKNSHAIEIKEVGFLDPNKKDINNVNLIQTIEGVQVEQGQCSFLESGGTCKEFITVDDKQDDLVIPVYVKYDIVDKNGGIKTSDIVATAAVIVNKNDSDEKIENKVVTFDDENFVEVAEEIAKRVMNYASEDKESAFVNIGIAFLGGSIKEACKNGVKILIDYGTGTFEKDSFVNFEIGEKGKVAHSIYPWLVGMVHSQAINKYFIGKPGDSWQNRIYTSTGKAVAAEVYKHMVNAAKVASTAGFGPTLVCDGLASIVGLWVDLYFFPEGKYLPENWNGYKNTIDYTVAAVVKVGCLGAFGYVPSVGAAVVALGGEVFAGYWKDAT